MKLWPFHTTCPACGDRGTNQWDRYDERFCSGGFFCISGPHLHRKCAQCGLRFYTATKQDMAAKPTGGEVSKC